MNRLERGGYFDIIQFQRKKERFSLDDIKKILGHDFETIWGAIAIVLKQDSDGFYFIEWVKYSIEKKKIYSKMQSNRANIRWSKEQEKNANIIPNSSQGNADGNAGAFPTQSLKENEDEYEKEYESRNKKTENEPELEKIPEINKPLWKQKTEEGFKEYLKIAESAFDLLFEDWVWIAERKRYHPGIHIRKSVEKMWVDFWGTKAGWENKRKAKTLDIDWKATIQNGLSMACNQVRIPRGDTDDELVALKTRRIEI